MKVYNNEITIARNETFTMDKYIQNRDGSPYIVSSMLDNPYLLVSVASSKYSQTDRYIYNSWLDLSTAKRFTTTVPINALTLYPSATDWTGVELPSGYEGDEDVTAYANYAVFYLTDSDGATTYKYWVYDDRSIDYSGTWTDYEFRFIKTFLQSVTKNWIEKTYYYNILLVAGTSTLETLTTLCSDNDVDITDYEDNLTYMYDQLYAISEDIVEDINIEKPIVNYSAVYTILETTKMSVLSNMKGVM